MRTPPARRSARAPAPTWRRSTTTSAARTACTRRCWSRRTSRSSASTSWSTWRACRPIRGSSCAPCSRTCSRWARGRRRPGAFKVMLREAMSPSPLAPALIKQAVAPKARLLLGLIGEIVGLPIDHPAVQGGLMFTVLPCIVLMIAPQTAGRPGAAGHQDAGGAGRGAAALRQRRARRAGQGASAAALKPVKIASTHPFPSPFSQGATRMSLAPIEIETGPNPTAVGGPDARPRRRRQRLRADRERARPRPPWAACASCSPTRR